MVFNLLQTEDLISSSKNPWYSQCLKWNWTQKVFHLKLVTSLLILSAQLLTFFAVLLDLLIANNEFKENTLPNIVKLSYSIQNILNFQYLWQYYICYFPINICLNLHYSMYINRVYKSKLLFSFKSWPTLLWPCSLPGFLVHGISQLRLL